MQQLRLEDQVAVVTGGGTGIGRHIAMALAESGASVVLAGRNLQRLQSTAAEIGLQGGSSIAVRTDLRVPDDVDHLAERTLDAFGRADVLVNNSGVTGPVAPLWTVDIAEWDDTLDTNVGGPFLCCRAFIPTMMEQGSGSVVMIGSIIGKQPARHRTPYAASKMALLGLTRSLASEVGPHGIRVNLVTPGYVEGDRLDRVLGEHAAEQGTSVTEARAGLVRRSPLERLVGPSDVAAMVVFLASSASSSITGADFNVNAGVVMH